MTTRRLLLATRNAHKTGEVRAILGPDWTVEDLAAHPDLPDVEETGVTFAENAALKALAASAHFPDAWVLADDSGLEVDALGGAPGVYSARYAGPDADDAENRRHLANELWRRLGDGWQSPQSARFHCNIAVALGGKIAGQFDGVVEGHVVHPEQGKGGFGYDPVFIPEGHNETFGVLPAELKNRLSHRAAALAKAMEFLRAQS
jgi:XTP/dITP diphosphohydrolase